MKYKKVISIILIILLALSSLSLISCSKKSDDNAEIQVWSYNHGQDLNYYNKTMSLISLIKLFCSNNNIPLKVMTYDSKTLSYEDYILKRNIAAAKGNMIIIEEAKYMWDLSKNHADYTKLKNYDKLLSAYKDRFCIPFGVFHNTRAISRSILDYYNIKLEKSVITYEEYLEIKQKMKENGAKFKLGISDYYETVDYYANKYGLKYINNESVIINNNDELKSALKSAIIETCKDYVKFNNSKLNSEDLDLVLNDNIYIYDENSGLEIYPKELDSIGNRFGLTTYIDYERCDEKVLDKVVFVINPLYTGPSPSFYMHKKITNERIYQIADFILNENSYKLISG